MQLNVPDDWCNTNAGQPIQDLSTELLHFRWLLLNSAKEGLYPAVELMMELD